VKIIAVIILSLFSISSFGYEPLIGKWQLDIDETIEQFPIDKQGKGARRLLTRMAETIEEYTDERINHYKNGEKKISYRYTVIEKGDSYVIIVTHHALREEEAYIRLDNNHMIISSSKESGLKRVYKKLN
jgi:HSP20 family molecular chaperone IbpA